MHPFGPSDIFGSVYLALGAATPLGSWFSVLALQDSKDSLGHATVALFLWSYAYQFVSNRSAKAGLARHSAMTNGSLPSASKSSRNTSGCFVSLAIRSISAWS